MRRIAILIIHGFAGGIYDQEDLANSLELISKFDVYSFTLPGHDKYILNNITKEDWMKAAENKVELLIKNGYKKICVVGHSMGGVIATSLAFKYKEIKKIVLAAPAFEYIFSDKSLNGFKNSIKQGVSVLKRFTGIKEILSRILRVPKKTVKEFRSLIDNHQEEIKKIDIPILIIHGTNDDIVPYRSSIKIFDKIPSSKKKLLLVKGLSHRVFRDIKQEEIIYETIEFLNKENKKMNIKKKI